MSAIPKLTEPMPVELYDTLAKLKEGDVIELAHLMPGLSQKEQVVWKVLEVAEVVSEPLKVYRLTLHAYYFEVFLFSVGVRICEGTAPIWSFS